MKLIYCEFYCGAEKKNSFGSNNIQFDEIVIGKHNISDIEFLLPRKILMIRAFLLKIALSVT